MTLATDFARAWPPIVLLVNPTTRPNE